MSLLFILLNVLKVILFIILVLILLILVLFLVVIISPIKYYATAERYENFAANIKIIWLFKILKIFIDINENFEIEIKLKILWFNLFKNKKENVSEKEIVTEIEKEQEKTITAMEREQEKSINEINNIKQADKMEDKENNNHIKFDKDIIQQKDSIKISENEQTDKKEKYSGKPRVKRIKLSEIDEFEKEIEKKEEEEKKKEEIEENKEEKINFEYFKNLENKKGFIKICIKFIKGILKGVKPKDIQVDATIGLKDPALTGYILAFSGMGKMFYGSHINVYGNFEKPMFEGACSIRGRIIIGYFIFILLRFILSKPIFKIIRILLKERKG